MKLSKSAFLAFATTIAASSCIIQSSDDDDGGAGGTSSGGAAQGGSAQGGSAQGGSAQGGSATGGSAQGGSGGGACDDSVGDTPACTPAAGTTCGQFAVDLCNANYAVMKPAVAEAANNCFLDPVDPLADCGVMYQCRADALAAACPDASADQLCDDVVANCGGTTDECHDLVDGLNAAGRAEIEECAVTQGCTFGLNSCVEGLGFGI